MTSAGNWTALATRLIEARRGLGFPSRASFVQDLVSRGLAKTSVDRVVGDLERAARTNYSPATLSALESWYQLPHGEVNRILNEHFDSEGMDQAAEMLRAGSEEEARVTLKASGWDLTGVRDLSREQLADLFEALATEIRGR